MTALLHEHRHIKHFWDMVVIHITMCVCVGQCIVNDGFNSLDQSLVQIVNTWKGQHSSEINTQRVHRARGTLNSNGIQWP